MTFFSLNDCCNYYKHYLVLKGTINIFMKLQKTPLKYVYQTVAIVGAFILSTVHLNICNNLFIHISALVKDFKS